MYVNFSFKVVDQDNQDRWDATISEFDDYGSFQRVVISAYGNRLEVLCGQCCSYRWIFLPELEIGCTQATLSDFFWNINQLGYILNRKDTFSTIYGVFYALSEVSCHV